MQPLPDRRSGPTDRRPRVVVVGCGFAGAAAAKALADRLAGRAEVVAFNGAPHLYNYPILPRSLMRPVPETSISVPLARVLGTRAVTLRIARVTAVDAGRREIRTDDGALAYDALVIACGARALPLPASENAFVLFPKATRHLARLHRWLEAIAQGRPEAPPAGGGAHRLVVAGGGLTGIEFAVAARELADALCARAGCPRERVEVSLLEQAERVAHECPEPVSAHVMEALAALGVTVRCRARVERAVGGGVVVNGETQPADVVMACVGSRPNLKRIALHGLGDTSAGIAVDRTLRSPLAPEVYAVGDNMRWPEPQAPNLKRGAAAVRQGHLAARNIARVLAGRPPLAYRPRMYTGILLGRRNALLAVGPGRVSGALAGQLKVYLERRGPP